MTHKNTEVPNLEDLPHRSLSQLKSTWKDVAKQIKQSGGIVITKYTAAKMVLMDAAIYQELTQTLKEQKQLIGVNERLAAKLKVLQEPEARKKLETLLAAKGVFKGTRPKAGS